MVRGQAPVDPKVQQLKDAWYKKAHELAELGAKLIEKNNLLVGLQDNMLSTTLEITADYSEQDRIAVGKAFPVMTKHFYDKLFQAIHDKVNVNDFLTQELIINKGDFFKNKEDCSGLLDSIKLILLHIIIEADLTKKLLEDYGNCLQKMAEIENDLVLLGQPRLYE